MEIKTQGFTTRPAEGQHRKTWGEKTLVTRLGKLNIVHLDSPSEEVIAERIKKVLRDELHGNVFEDDCPNLLFLFQKGSLDCPNFNTVEIDRCRVAQRNLTSTLSQIRT